MCEELCRPQGVGWGGAAPSTAAETLMQPVVKPTVRQADPTQKSRPTCTAPCWSR